MSQKEHIVDQAMQMFITQGIKAVRMDDIAQHLGVSKRTLYELFGDKESLLYLAMKRYFESIQCNHVALTTNADNVLEALFMVLSSVMDKAELTKRMMTNLSKFYPSVYKKMVIHGAEKNRVDLSRMLEQGVAEGLFIDDFNHELAISVLYNSGSAFMTGNDIILPEGMTQHQAVVQVITTFFRGISTPKGLQLMNDYLKKYNLANSNIK